MDGIFFFLKKLGPLGTFSRLNFQRLTGIKVFARLRKKEMKPNLSFPDIHFH